MSLINRVSAFFLTALAVTLLGYSATLFLLVRNHLYQQFDDGLQNALRILSASVEVESDDAKWQPGEFSVDLAALQDVLWIVSSERGQMIDHSAGFARSDPKVRPVYDYSAKQNRVSNRPVNVGGWRVIQNQLDAPTPKPAQLREAHEYAGVRITVARSPLRLQEQTRQLVVVVVVLPIVLWLIAAAAGRRYFRQALKPLRAMSDRARSMDVANFKLRLPVPPARDELSDLGTAFNGLLGRLQQAFDREHRFTGHAAHQLRTPLTVLQGQIDVALRRPREPEEYRRTLQVLADQVAEFRQIVTSLLFLVRSEETASVPDLAPLAVGQWMATYAHRWDNHPRRQDLEVRSEVIATVVTSPPLLSQLVDNLVANALKYSDPGTPVVLRSALENGRVVLVVEDRGAGIALDDRERVFEPFFRADSARAAGIAGTGLGLAVAARIAAALSASLRCESAPGQGSTFRVILSRSTSDPPSPELQSTPVT